MAWVSADNHSLEEGRVSLKWPDGQVTPTRILIANGAPHAVVSQRGVEFLAPIKGGGFQLEQVEGGEPGAPQEQQLQEPAAEEPPAGKRVAVKKPASESN